MFTVAITDYVREMTEVVDFETEAEAVEYVEMYADDDIDLMVNIYDESDIHYYIDDGALITTDEDDDYDYDLECGFDPYEGCYTWDC